MSIYAVELSEWFPPGDPKHDTLIFILPFHKCPNCGKKKMHWQEAYGDHSVPWGYGDVFCRKKCYINYGKKRK